MNLKNKKILAGCLSFLMVVVLVYAQAVLSANDTNVSTSKACKDKLIELGLNNIKNSDCNTISEDKCQYSIINGTINLGTHNINTRYCDTRNETSRECLSYTNFTTIQIENTIDKTTEEWIKYYCKTEIDKDIIVDTTPKALGGDVTITGK